MTRDHPSFLAGLAASLPIMLGYLPIAFSFGVAATRAGFSSVGAIALSLISCAGSPCVGRAGVGLGLDPDRDEPALRRAGLNGFCPRPDPPPSPRFSWLQSCPRFPLILCG
jgi:hypothetical protein